jgi:hypothetical protein
MIQILMQPATHTSMFRAFIKTELNRVVQDTPDNMMLLTLSVGFVQ